MFNKFFAGNPFFSFFGYNGTGTQKSSWANIKKSRKADVPVPRGCKAYYFNKEGDFKFKADGVFHVRIIALNDKNAVRKFEGLQKKS